MSEHCGYVVKIDKIEPHFNADRLQIVDIFGASVIVDLSTKQGDLGVYFPVDLQLSEEYCAQNNLVRKLDENGNNIGGYLEPNKRNIRAMKLRGAKSEGLFMPLESLGYTGVTKFEIGDKIEILNGHEICRKYIPRGRKNGGSAKGGNRVRKRNVVIAPLFAEHADTEQLAYNLDAFKPNDQIEITLKMHGTSGRTGYLPKLVSYKRSLWDKIFKREGTPIYNWGYVTGTRRVVLEDFDQLGGFYGNNKFREPHAKVFEGKLWKGETVYYEIVGFTDNGVPIMPSVSNSKVNDKEFTKMYGKTTTFSYGCEPCGVETVEDCGEYLIEKEVPQSDMYVYRMTMTNEDGDVVEYTPDFMRYRCAQMGVKTVPILWSGFLDPDVVNELGMINPDNENEIITIPNAAGQWIKDTAEEYYDGPDPIGKTHVREGVVVRIVNRPKFTAYKHKNFSFKCLEGIAKDIAEAPDMEEAQEVVEDEN